MSRMERLVRPFQTDVITPPRRVLTDYQPAEPEPLITLEYGRNGSGKILQGSYSSTVTRYMDTKLKETTISLASSF